MPLVRIDVTEQYTTEQVRGIADAVHRAIVAEYGIPERDRFQIVSRHPAWQLVAEDAGLGFERDAGVVMLQIFTQGGRDTEAKQALYAAIARELGELGVAGENLFLGYVENGPQDWSFGFGRAQYLTGELAVPDPAQRS